jgi:beta-glucosidase
MEKVINDLMGRMTLEEKVSLLAGRDFWHTRSIERLGIPAIKVTDGPYGVRTMADDDPDLTIPATCFPTGVAMAATWNPELIYQVGEALGEETAERGCAVLLGPCVNIHRSPLGGRNFESFSEDPYLSSQMAQNYVSGVQSQNVGVSIKHFALNNSEFQRFTISSEADERTKREIYFPSFEKVVREVKPWTVMCSYNRIDGIYASENTCLLTDVLKKEWGFEGVVMSDWFATHSGVPAARAGLDLEMPGPARYFGDALLSAVKSGEVSEEIINDKVQRILRLVMKVNDQPGDPLQRTVKKIGLRTRRRLAREVAEEAIVLLKNENDILPLRLREISSIAVIGPNAKKARFGGGGSSLVKPEYTISPWEGLKKRCRGKVKLAFEQGCANNRLTPVLDSKFAIPTGGKRHHGLMAEYFANDDLSGEPTLRKVEKEFVHRWFTEAPPGPGIDSGNFSMRWTGLFLAPMTGRYRFGLFADGVGRIIIDKKLIVESGVDQTLGAFNVKEEVVGEVTLKEGKDYDILIEYRKNPRIQSAMANIRAGCELPQPADMQERAVNLAAHSDVALVFAGLNEEHESEGFDREKLSLPADQMALISAVAAVNRNTIVILNSGSPVSMDGWIDKVPAIVESWFPGQEGGNAIFSVLVGEVNPSGRLPDTFPRRIEDNPAYGNYPGENGKVFYREGIFVGYRHYDARGIEPLFPFGHGLSYTDFDYSNLRVSPTLIKTVETAIVLVDITNTGRRKGKEVVQLYIQDVNPGVPRPIKELKRFEKISLRPGETGTVSFTLDKEALSFYHPELKKWVAEPGEFEILVGASSRDIRAKATFILEK